MVDSMQSDTREIGNAAMARRTIGSNDAALTTLACPAPRIFYRPPFFGGWPTIGTCKLATRNNDNNALFQMFQLGEEQFAHNLSNLEAFAGVIKCLIWGLSVRRKLERPRERQRLGQP